MKMPSPMFHRKCVCTFCYRRRWCRWHAMPWDINACICKGCFIKRARMRRLYVLRALRQLTPSMARQKRRLEALLPSLRASRAGRNPSREVFG